MPNWILKSVVQRAISLCPRSERVNEVFQIHVTGGLRIEAQGEFRAKLDACKHHLENYRKWSTSNKSGFTVLELGTGWYPIIPIGLYLCGASEIWTFDIVPLLRPDRLRTIIDYYYLFQKTGELNSILPGIQQERLQKMFDAATGNATASPAAMLERLNIHYRVQSFPDAGLDSGCMDLIFSHGVLEHLEREVLMQTFLEFHRVASPTSVITCYIGIADQFAAFDKTITSFNYMRYSARVWRLLNSPMIPQNRLRACDYRSICRQARFSIQEESTMQGVESDLHKLKLSSEFARYSKEDLLGLYYWLVAVPQQP